MSVEAGQRLLDVGGAGGVHFGREWSLFDFAERCAQAAEAGFVGLGLWHADIEHQLEDALARGHAAAILDDNGLRCYELEFLWDWFVDDEDRGPAADRAAQAAVRGGRRARRHHVKAGNIPGKPCEMPRLNERYAELCADAAQLPRLQGRSTSSCRST